MSPSSLTSKVFWIVPVLSLALALTPAGSSSAFAQTSAPAAASASPAKPGAVGNVKTKSKETWADMKARWAKQKDRWAECQKRGKAEKRSRTASREFLEACMSNP